MYRRAIIVVFVIVAGFSFGFGAEHAIASDCDSFGESHCGEGNWVEASNPNQCVCAIYCIGFPNTVYELEPCET